MPILSHLHQLFDVDACCAYIHRLRWKDRPLQCLRCQSPHRPLRQRAKPPLRGTAPARHVLSGPTCARCGPFSCNWCPGSPSRCTPSSVCRGHALWLPMTIASLPRACATPLERLIA